MKTLMTRLLLSCALVLPVSAQAQVAWDAPLLLPPRAGPGLGLFLADVAGGGLGVVGTWRPGASNYGLRIGIAEAAGGDLAVYGGVDYSGFVHAATADFPIDIDWVFGAGAGIGDGVLLSLPLGISAGHTFRGSGAQFTPYLTPRVVLDASFGDESVDDDLGLDVAVDLGLDLSFTRAGPLSGRIIRFGGTIGGRDAVAIGVVF